ncbi:hypothetical protein ACFW1P_01290 [Paenibacillus sp. NPDC058910]|uniref:hypothetical protein n=1 Tax=unclassified Paenibacillus TaxID=185978 RepID=UPI0036A7CD83
MKKQKQLVHLTMNELFLLPYYTADLPYQNQYLSIATNFYEFQSNRFPAPTST